MPNIMINDTLKSYCQDVDRLTATPSLAPEFLVPQPKSGDQMILLHTGIPTEQTARCEIPVVIQITHGQYSVHAESWLYHATLVGCRDFSQRDRQYAKDKLNTGEEGEITGIWCDGIFILGNNKFQDYREWVIRRLLPEDEHDTSGVNDETLRNIKIRNEVINLNLTDFDETPLLTTGCSIAEIIRWARPASDNLPLVGKMLHANDKRTFMGQWEKINAELDQLRKLGRVSGLTPKLAQKVAGLVIRIAAFGQTWTREKEWYLLTLWALRLNELVCTAPEGSPVDPILTPVKIWLNEFVFPE